jgi:pyruvate-formate lyase
MLKADFEGYDSVYEKIASLPKFGNDNDEDHYTAEIANTLIDAVEGAYHTEKE